MAIQNFDSSEKMQFQMNETKDCKTPQKNFGGDTIRYDVIKFRII